MSILRLGFGFRLRLRLSLGLISYRLARTLFCAFKNLRRLSGNTWRGGRTTRKSTNREINIWLFGVGGEVINPSKIAILFARPTFAARICREGNALKRDRDLFRGDLKRATFVAELAFYDSVIEIIESRYCISYQTVYHSSHSEIQTVFLVTLSSTVFSMWVTRMPVDAAQADFTIAISVRRYAVTPKRVIKQFSEDVRPTPAAMRYVKTFISKKY